MQYRTLLFSALAFGSTAQAHMAPAWPWPFRAEYNPHSIPADIDYSITSPLDSDGSNFPCKGYQVDLNDTTGAGASVATYEAGSEYNMSVGTGSLHGGGSCQVSLSYDKGVSFTVIHSYIGSCPISYGQKFDFTVPSDAPTGAAMFAWTWYNMIGDREIYMDCASVTVTGASSKVRSAPAVAFSDRPSIFVANLGNGCQTIENTEVVFPDPGPDVTYNKTEADTDTISGTCAAVKGIGGGNSSSAGAAAASSGTTSLALSSTSSTASESAATSSATTLATSVSVYTVPTVSTTATSSVDVSPLYSNSSAAASGGVFNTITTSDSQATATASPVTTSTLASSASPSSAGNSSTSSGSAITAGTTCSNEGEWNCVDGTSFQQCASGSWSIVQPLAAGTSCTGGESSSIDITRRLSRGKRVRQIRRHP